MIKGVNRQVLEVHETGTKYFEKALFFVKPEYSTLGERRLNEKALQALSGHDKVPVTRHAKIKNIVLKIVCLLLSAMTGAGVTLLLR